MGRQLQLLKKVASKKALPLCHFFKKWRQKRLKKSGVKNVNGKIFHRRVTLI
jgi:hypothetical protein